MSSLVPKQLAACDFATFILTYHSHSQIFKQNRDFSQSITGTRAGKELSGISRKKFQEPATYPSPKPNILP